MQGEILLAPYNTTGEAGWADSLPLPVRCTRAGRVLDAAIAAVRRVPAGFFVRFDGMATRTAVAGLVGDVVHFPRQRLARLSAQEFFVEDLVGCEAHLEDGRRLGRVTGTFWNGAHDVMSIAADDGAEHWLPALPGFILRYDAASRRLTVDPHE